MFVMLPSAEPVGDLVLVEGDAEEVALGPEVADHRAEVAQELALHVDVPGLEAGIPEGVVHAQGGEP
jgi:hypothetical protein